MTRAATWRLVKPLRGAIRAGHPWIYDRALSPVPRGVEAGDLVTIVDDDGPVAIAFADPASPIRARVLEVVDSAHAAAGRFDAPVTGQFPAARRLDAPGIDGVWVRGRIEAAAQRRTRDPRLVGCSGRRLVHGEGDGCPGLVVDVYGETAVIVFDGRAASTFWRPHLDLVLDALERGGAPIAHAWLRGERRDKTAGANISGGASPPGPMAVRGDPPAEIVITEDEARFGVDVRAGQKTGFFLDQRENRRTIRAHAAGATVLNVFSYTGGFSLHAALGGATLVTSVDLAAPAIASLAKNLEHAGLPAAAHELVTADAFDHFARAQRQGRRWDLVIVDPPSFAPSERARQSALGAYRKLVVAALGVVAPGGRFALASCSSHITEADLLEIASTAQVGPLRLRLVAGAASDHPVLPGFPEGRYLKFLFFDVG